MRVDAEGLGHRFPGGEKLFDSLSFRVTDGDLTAIRGASGSGKSTLLSIIAGWVVPTEGSITSVGVKGLTWVAQNPFGVPRRTALDHAVLPLLASGVSRTTAERKALSLFHEFRLEAIALREFGQLSGGEAQRLMLARAVLSGADLVLVDEPTAQLDPLSAMLVVEVLHAMAGANRAVLVATHDPRVADACEKSIVLGAKAQS